MHRVRLFKTIFSSVFLCAALSAVAMGQSGSTTVSPADTSVKKVGVITAIQGSTLTVKPDSGADLKAMVPEGARILRLQPGQTDLKTATPVQLSEAQVGDRVLFRGKLANDGVTVTVSTIVVMKQSDVAQKQQHEREEWQKNGVGGIVRTVSAEDGSITIATTPKESILVHTAKTTGFLRYANGSVKFSDAARSTFDQIKVGDQIRARGAKSGDGKELTADEVISGSFQNIAGTIQSVDAGASAITVKDVLSKKTVVVKIGADSQMHSLPQPMAQRIAMMLKGPSDASKDGDASAAAGATHGSGNWRGGEQQGSGSGSGNGRPNGPPDFQRMVARLPETKLADLQKDQAVMIVATEPVSDSPGTAITVLTGVEPILTASPGASGAAGLLSSWNLSSSGDVQ